MPRLTNERYYQRHQLLRQLWLKHEQRFSLLRPNQQWDVHDYYRPSEKLTKKELIRHRRQISRQRRALPHRASKAFKILAGRAPAPAPTLIKAGSGRRVTVRSVVHPQIGVERLSRALIAMAEYQAREKKKSDTE